MKNQITTPLLKKHPYEPTQFLVYVRDNNLPAVNYILGHKLILLTQEVCEKALYLACEAKYNELFETLLKKLPQIGYFFYTALANDITFLGRIVTELRLNSKQTDVCLKLFDMAKKLLITEAEWRIANPQYKRLFLEQIPNKYKDTPLDKVSDEPFTAIGDRLRKIIAEVERKYPEIRELKTAAISTPLLANDGHTPGLTYRGHATRTESSAPAPQPHHPQQSANFFSCFFRFLFSNPQESQAQLTTTSSSSSTDTITDPGCHT